MAPDDVHDLFDTREADDSDDAAEDGSDGPSERAGFPPLTDDGPAEPADRGRDAAAESTSPSSETSVEDAGGFEMAVEEDEGGFEMGAEEDAGGSETARDATTPGRAEDDDAGGFEMGGPTTSSSDDDGFELAESTTSSTGLVEDDTDGFEPAGESAPERPVEGDTDEPEPSLESAPEGSESDDADESESTSSTTATQEATDADAVAPESAARPTASEGAARDDAAGSATGESTASPSDVESTTPPFSDGGPSTASSPGSVGQYAAQTTEPAGPAAAEPGSSSADRGASASAGATTSADDPPAGHDEQGAASPEEPGPTPSGTAAEEEVAAIPGSNRLPLGIDELDRAMGGGVPPGRLVVLVADPGVQSELIVDSVLAQRDTLYVTTDRPDWEVQKDIEPGLGTGEVVIRDHSPDSLLSGLDSLLEGLGTSSNFVLDSVNELELVPRNRYRVFLSDVKRRLFDTGSIGLLTGVTVGHESARDLTLRRADIVLRLETRTSDREIQNLLSVPKFRGGAAIKETFKLELTDEVEVDTSWNEA